MDLAHKKGRVSFNTHRKENKQKFDSAYFLFEKIDEDMVKINGHLGFGFKLCHLIYFIIALVYGFHLAGQTFISGFMATIVFIILLIPMFLPDSLKIKRTAKKPAFTLHLYKTHSALT
ncbi:hypothetical protein J7W08_03455 [Methanococcoides orientis]|uniref:hypothetical protein n=1 Tax=Methanococcoides orientis TaxID=2822137 RepID=UPI001E506EC9|nr:hypothetical protein [Methanococcoides orientis]UGV41366.1 hypothetical protein J7W08_03455 [Methanococcoides orientis]